jgi:hypothetical protein
VIAERERGPLQSFSAANHRFRRGSIRSSDARNAMPIVKLKARWAQATARPGVKHGFADHPQTSRNGRHDRAKDEEERTDACQLERDEPTSSGEGGRVWAPYAGIST